MTRIVSDDAVSMSKVMLDSLLRQAQVGRNINGLTHDINNFLGAIMAYAELIESQDNLSAESKRMIEEMLGAIEQSNRLLSTLTTISRKPGNRISSCDVIDVTCRVCDLFRYEYRIDQIELIQRFHTSSAILQLDEAKYQRVLMYVFANAMEYAKHTSLKQICISSEHTEETVIVSLNVPGYTIDESEQEEMFKTIYVPSVSEDPIIGLSTAREIIREIDGSLYLDSESGYRIVLPAS